MIPLDKLLHFKVGFILGLISIVLAITAGIFKEIYDKYHNGTVEINDVWATTLGGVCGQIVSAVIVLLISLIMKGIG